VTPSELIQAGERLYGQGWRQPLADALGVNIATLRRWTGGYIAIPRRTELAVQNLLVAKRLGITTTARE
jgi:hypothetical protein